MRRTLFIILGLLIVIGVIVGIYFLFFAQKGAGITAAPGATIGTSDGAVAIHAPDVGVATQGAGTVIAPRLVKITDQPVAEGAVAFPVLDIKVITVGTSTATTTIPDTEIRYAERASGNIYAYRATARTLTRLTHRTLPGIQQAFWTADGARAFLRFISTDNDGSEHVETYVLPVVSEDSGFLLERDVDELAVTGSSTLLTLIENTTGSVGTIASVSGTGAKTLFSSSLSSLRIFPYKTGFTAFTRASASMDGYGFSIDGKSGASARLLGPLPGLSLLPSPSGKLVLYSYVDGTNVRSAVLNVATHTATAIPVATLAEKCAWAPDDSAIYCAVPRALFGTLPDDWYQGATGFSDRIWKVDLAGRVASLLVDPATAGDTAVDATALTLDSKADILVFTNKRDGSLWAYDL